MEDSSDLVTKITDMTTVIYVPYHLQGSIPKEAEMWDIMRFGC